MKLEAFRELTQPNKAGRYYHKVLELAERFYIPLFILSALVIAYLCFYRLDAAYIASFDEARHGVNAYEMLQTGSPFVNTYNYANDYWNLKPPLSYWCIMLSFKLFGYSIFSLRFYSALCYFITCTAAGLFLKQYSKLASLLAMGFFSASTLAFVAHMARAGDADALYTMLFTLAMLAMIRIPENKKMLYICGLCFSLAFLTKSWHAGVIVVIGGLFLLFTGELKKLTKKEWLFFILSFTVPVLLWAIARFAADGPVFFVQMVRQDLLNRTGSAIEGHDYPFSFYYDYIFKGDYIYRTAMILVFIGAVFFNTLFQNTNLRKFLGYILWFFVPFLAFSISSTKLIWYVYPTLIPLVMAASILTARLLHSTHILFKIKWILLAAVILLLGNYTKESIRYVQNVHGDEFQQFMESSVQRDSPHASANAYIFTNGGEAPVSDWTQADLFLGEIYGDYRCTDGGMEAFLRDSRSGVLYISADYYALFKDKELKNCTVLYETRQYLLLSR